MASTVTIRGAEPAGAGRVPTEEFSLNFSFPPRAMHGDDVAVTCTGEFPARVEVTVTHEVRGKRGRPTTHTFVPEDGRFEFIVGTSKLARGMVEFSIKSENSTNIGSCSLKREKVEAR